MTKGRQDKRAASNTTSAMAVTEFGELLSALARRWAERRVGALKGYRQIFADYGTGRADSQTTASAVAKLATEEAVRYPGELLELASDYVSGLAGLAGLKTTGEAREAATGAVYDLALSGNVGDTPTAEIVIENPRDKDVTIGFAATAFSNETRATKITPSFDPASCTLSPGSEQIVIVSVKIDGRTLKAGENYIAKAIVDGFDEMVLRLNLTVDPS